MSDDPLTLFLLPRRVPNKTDYLENASSIIAEYFDFDQKEVSKLLWECHEQAISDMSLVLHNHLAFATAERPLSETIDIYHRAEKVGRRVSYAVYLRAPNADDEDAVDITRVGEPWIEYLPEIERFN